MTGTLRVSGAGNRNPANTAFWWSLALAAPALHVGGGWHPTPDALEYLATARSLASGDGWTGPGNAPPHYPPGYPAIAAAAFALPGSPFVWLSAIQALLAVCGIVGLWRWARESAPETGPWIPLLTFSTALVWISGRRTLSDLAFLAVCPWLAVALDRLVAGRGGRGALLSAAALAVVATSIREVGALFVGGALIAALVGGRSPGRVLVVAGAAALFGGALLAASDVERLAGLLDPAKRSPVVLLEGIRLRVSEIGRLIVPGMFRAYGPAHVWLEPNMLVYLPLAAAVAVGWGRRVRRSPDVWSCTLPLWIAIFVLWRADGGGRYAVPMAPPIFLAAWSMLPAGLRRERVLGALVGAHVLVSAGWVVFRDAPRIAACNASWPAIRESVAAAAPGSRIMEPPDGATRCERLLHVWELERVGRDGDVRRLLAEIR